MGAKSAIEWTDSTWNPTRGCSRISPGCLNCYAERVGGRFCGEGQPFEGYVERDAKGKAFWTRKVGLVPEHLTLPLSWQKGRRIFVDSMSDLFHEDMPDDAIDAVLAVMLLTPRHTFQVLTKRAERMRDYFRVEGLYKRVLRHVDDLREHERFERKRRELYGVGVSDPAKFLPKHIWLGVSVESQDYTSRVAALIETPARVKFLSCEPLLGPLDLERIKAHPAVPLGYELDALRGILSRTGGAEPSPSIPALRRATDQVSWVIVGGESGTGARSMHLEWARALVAQCKGAGVPVFVKQLGGVPTVGYYDEEARAYYEDEGYDWPDPEGWHESDGQPSHADRVVVEVKGKGGDPSEWPPELRAQEFPWEGVGMRPVKVGDDLGEQR